MNRSTLTTRRPGRRAAGMLALAAALVLAPMQVAQAATDPGRTISVAVQTSNGVPVADSEVTLYSSAGDYLDNSWTDDNGMFTFKRLSADTFKVGVQHSGYADWYVQDKSTLDTADAIDMTTETSRSFTATLSRGQTISGHLSLPAGIDDAGVEVVAYRLSNSDWDAVKWDAAVDDGDYAIGGLPAGTYRVCVDGDASYSDTGAPIPRVCRGPGGSSVYDIAAAADIAVASAAVPDRDITVDPPSVSGTVRDSSGTPVEGANVSTWDGTTASSATTGADGGYFVYVAPGDVTIDAYDGGEYAAYDNDTPITVGATDHLTGRDIQFGAAGSDGSQYLISGRVTGPGGIGMPDVNVYAYDADGNEMGEGSTAGSGRYTLNLWDWVPGDYTVQFAPDEYGASSGYADQWWQDAAHEAGATPVTLTDLDNVVTGINATLAGGTVSGTVTDTSASALAGVTVTEYRYNSDYAEWDSTARTSTGANGGYTLAAPPGKVRVCFGQGGTAADRHVVAQCYGGSGANAENASDVAVANGGAVAGIDIALTAAVKVTGTVSDGDGPVVGANVELSGDSVDSNATTNALGRYALWIQPGTYAAYVYADGHTSDQEQVDVGASGATGIDFQLKAYGALTGVVKGAGGLGLADVTVRAEGDDGTFTARTNANGAYTLAVEPGDYVVGFEADGYVDQYYNGAPRAGQAAPVTVAEGAKRSLDDVTLIQAGAIGGTVRDADTSPVVGATVKVYVAARSNLDGWRSIGTATTDDTGAYTVGDLDPAGKYRVGVSTGTREQFYPTALGVRGADTLDGVTSGGTLTVDITLAAALHLGGTVIGGPSHAPLEGIVVPVQRKHTDRFGKYSWRGAGSVTTAADGTYDVPVSKGIYRLRFRDPSRAALPTWYTGIAARSTHKQDALEIDATTSGAAGLDVDLPYSDTISGTITLGGTTTDTGWVEVYAQRSDDSWDEVAWADADEGGAYVVTGLAPGTYRVGLQAEGADEVYYASTGNVTSIDAAESITFADYNQSRSGVDADLSVAPTYDITGQVVDPDDNGAADVDVEVDRQLSDGTWDYFSDGWTDDSGAFDVAVPAGVYRVQAGGDGVYAGSYYIKDGSGERFTTVTVTDAAVSLANPIRLGVIARHAVTGLVSGPNGAVKGAHVLLCESYGPDDSDYDCEDGENTATTTDADGHYSLSVPDGLYKLIVTTDGAYSDSIDELDVDGVDVNADVTLQLAGSVTGSVSGPSGPLNGDFEVDVYRQSTEGSSSYWDQVGYDYVTAGATYAITGLQPGTYRACLYAPSGLASQCYGGAVGSYDPASGGTDIVVTGGGASTADFALEATHTVSGTVTDSVSGDPVEGIYVEAYTEDGSGDLVTLGDASTDEDGRYSVTVPTGDYAFRLYDGEGDYPELYYGSQLSASVEGAGQVAIDADVTGRDVSLVKGAAIAGTVRWPDAGDKYGWFTTVSAVDVSSGAVVQTQYVSSGDPYYSLMGLAAGTYRLDFARSSTQRLSGPTMTVPEAQFSGGINEGAGPGGSTKYMLTSGGAPTMDADATLHNGLVLTGTIADPNGNPLADCLVTAYTTDDHLVSRGSYLSGSDGAYGISGLTNGSYDLSISGDDGSDCNQGTRYLTNLDGSTGGAGSALAAVPISRSGANTQDISYGAPKLTTHTPTITGLTGGVPIVGTTLTAVPGAWSPSGASFAYQWYADGVPIDGAQAKTFVPTTAELGAKLSVDVTGSAAGYSDTTVRSDQTAPVDLPTLVNTAAPVISGTAVPGQTLSVSPGTWSPNTGLTLHYAWKVGDASVGTDSNEYVVQAGDVGSAVTVTVTAHRTGYHDASAVAAARTVQNAAVTLTGTPQITGATDGSAVVGQPLGVDTTALTTDPSDATLTYQWLRDGNAIGSATGESYTPIQDDAGSMISVAVTATKAGFADSAAARSASVSVTSVVPVTELKNVDPPTVSGKAKVGYTLTAHGGTWDPDTVTLSYQWRANSTVIAGATGRTFRPRPADVGRTITVVVTATDAVDGLNASAIASAATRVARGTIAGARPTISGKAKVGKKLKASAGATSPKGVTIKFQWLRNGKPIKHATGAKYKLTKKDKGKKVSVRVTRTKAGYTTLKKVSKAKKVKKG